MNQQKFDEMSTEDQEAFFAAGLCISIELDDCHTIQVYKKSGLWFGILTRKVDGIIYKGQLVDNIPTTAFTIDNCLIIRYPPDCHFPDPEVIREFGPTQFRWQLVDIARIAISENEAPR